MEKFGYSGFIVDRCYEMVENFLSSNRVEITDFNPPHIHEEDQEDPSIPIFRETA